MTAAPSALEQTVHVALGPRSYDVRVVSGGSVSFSDFVGRSLAATWGGRGCRSALVVTDRNLAEQPWKNDLVDRLQGLNLEVREAVVPPGEASKSIEQISALYDFLVESRADRHTLVVAIGGGVVGDLAGFAAATYARGVPLLMIPTSLLAQVDSSVGGKVGINHPGAKNIIGAFHQPIGVWVDTDSLGTLPPRELRCGLAEVVKYGVILDAAFFDYVEQNVDAILAGDAAALRRIVARSCALKADVVSKDEREETGLRAVLNYGHTIGHAVEAVAGYEGDFQHGEAVAVGMVAESRLAQRLGWIGPEVVDRQIRLLERIGLPTSAPGLDRDRLLSAMSRDKKNRGGRIRFVLPREIGRVELTDAASTDDLQTVLESL
jgi:3-dehydroquinate synthase